ncbi:MAG: tRNA 2-thiouridine(34) synthase MnmA, partial [Candidatus Hydrogenedentes bacterium]|nr:tRNA 2-thiouridine(34) synthase MnmA [Candidatus Hydrogenedentota bacterium]
SGGVDSSVAAALLAEQGYDVIGMTMRVASGEGRESSQKACCTLDAAEDARRVAHRLGISHYVVNYLDRFEREVIDDFVDEYLAGRTPNPCARCNQRVKFGALFEKAAAIGADYIATGHYVRCEPRNGRHTLRRAVYRPKDQSYSLAGLRQDQLARALFPLGGLTKEETREKARAFGLVTANKPESQEICFVPDNNYRNFLAQRVGSGEPGPILSVRGEVLGRHAGLMNYTVGQRKGLRIAAAAPQYVLQIDLSRNALVVGPQDEAFSESLAAADVIWGALSPQTEPFDCLVQIRYQHAAVPATVYPNGTSFTALFHTPQRAVTPGQWAVLYDDDYVLAGGIIR